MAVFDQDNLPPDIAALMETTASMIAMLLEKGIMSSDDAIAMLQRVERAITTGQISQSTRARLESALKLDELGGEAEAKVAEQAS